MSEHSDPVADHYERLLAGRYVWMLGGQASAVAAAGELAGRIAPAPAGNGRAVDLAGGPGFFAAALAARGFAVDLVDTSRTLLALVPPIAGPGAVRVHHTDMVRFLRTAGSEYELVTCLGDSITHLGSRDDVAELCDLVRARLTTGGRFVATYRDLSEPRSGPDRFVLVRAEAERILTCFLEHTGDRVLVHDLFHEREGDTWSLHRSSYPKLVVPVAWLEDRLRSTGLRVTTAAARSGMVEVVATR